MGFPQNILLAIFALLQAVRPCVGAAVMDGNLYCVEEVPLLQLEAS